MITVTLRPFGDLEHEVTARGRTVHAATRNAGRKLGAKWYGCHQWVQEFPGGNTAHVQFGRSMSTGGMSLSQSYVRHIVE